MNFDDIRRQIETMDEKLNFAYRIGGVLATSRRRIFVTDEAGMLGYIKERNRYASYIGVPQLGPRDYMAISAEDPIQTDLPSDTVIDSAEILCMDQKLVGIYSGLESFADRREILDNAGRLLGRRNCMALNAGVTVRSAESYMEEAFRVFYSRSDVNTPNGVVNFKRFDEQIASMDSKIITFLRTGDGKLRNMTDDQRRNYLAQRNCIAAVLGYSEETFDDYSARLRAEEFQENEQLIRKRKSKPRNASGKAL